MPVTESLRGAGFKVNAELDWLSFKVPDNLNWDAILAVFSVSVSKKFLTSVKHL